MTTEKMRFGVDDSNLGEMLLSKNPEDKNMAMGYIQLQYGGLILSILRKKGIRPDDEADVIQEVYLAILKYSNRNERIERIEAFLMTVTHRQVLMYKRDGGRNARKMHSLALLSHRENNVPKPEDVCLREERIQQVRQAITELSDFSQELIHDRFWGEKPFAEISKKCDRTVKALDHQVRVARKSLKQKLSPYFT